jgi:hypothetical protein
VGCRGKAPASFPQISSGFSPRKTKRENKEFSVLRSETENQSMRKGRKNHIWSAVPSQWGFPHFFESRQQKAKIAENRNKQAAAACVSLGCVFMQFWLFVDFQKTTLKGKFENHSVFIFKSQKPRRGFL